MSKRTSYEWKPLKDVKNNIRLLTLKPNKNWHAPIECELSETSIEQSLQYSALSYVCGSPKITQPIMLDGYAVEVYANLELALRHLRKLNNDNKTLWWVDAVCINQGDVEEKSVQVSMLSTIYAHAEQVIAWLGPADKNSKNVIKTINAFCRVCKNVDVLEELLGDVPPELFSEYCSRVVMRSLRQLRKYMGKYVPFDLSTQESAQQVMRSEIHAVQKVLSRDWWSRLWVYQELLLARKRYFLLGLHLLPAENLSVACHMLINLTHLRAVGSPFGLLFTAQYGLLEDLVAPVLSSSKTRPLINNITRTRILNCQDPRDRIFAISSLASDRDLAVLNAPDYNLTYRQVLVRLTKTYLSTHHDLDILNTCRYTGKRPSWIPELETDIVHSQVAGNLLWSSEEGRFVTATSINSKTSFDKLDSLDPEDFLHIGGFILGKTIRVSTLSRLEDFEAPNTELMQRWKAMIPRGEDGERLYLEQEFWMCMSATRYPWGHDELNVQEDIDQLNLVVNSKLEAWPNGMPVHIRRARSSYFFTTSSRHMGRSDIEIQEGDIIAVFAGSQTPFVLRLIPGLDDEVYLLMGDCYVYGVMNGELMDDYKKGKFEHRDFKIG